MPLFIIKYVTIALLISGIGYLGFDKIYTLGYNSAAKEYIAKLSEYENNLSKRIRTIEDNSRNILDNQASIKDKAAKDFKSIMLAAKAKPLVVYQNGNCDITEDFTKAYLDAIKRANQR